MGICSWNCNGRRRNRRRLSGTWSKAEPPRGRGFRPSDVIVAFDGHKIESQGDLQRFQAKASPGQSVDIGIRRHGIASTVFNLVLGSGPPPEAAQRSAAEPASMLAQDRPAAGLPPGPPDGFGGERKDFDVRPQTTLQYNVGTHTPTSLPGAHVINTEALARIKNGMLLIDAWNDRSHATLPGAIRMPAAGAAGSFDDATQAALRTALAIRTDHNMMKPLVFFCAGVNCWNPTMPPCGPLISATARSSGIAGASPPGGRPA